MVTVRMFIPYMNMKSRFEAAVSRLEPQDDVRVELLHVFGTPESLSRYGDADILVARGMTYDRLRYLFPEKHVVEIPVSYTHLDVYKRQAFYPGSRHCHRRCHGQKERSLRKAHHGHGHGREHGGAHCLKD